MTQNHHFIQQDQRIPENNSPDQRIPENNSPDQRIPENNSPNPQFAVRTFMYEP
jgi:hypothetical protein